ncbi:putative Mu-like prophage protein gp16 [Candidatus Defluviicoccus seviourii]|uniref:Mu-like prophage protein gp16 n=1 Tax=Candidatus Defluviicoccus seviourii TaxID=2565273 RepID=A0A564WHE6_9PROT|nr:putative Mu-like prophage protein gp16 [Candidatus Defluviicoccus seviourii]
MADPDRQRQLKAIHVRRRQLGLDEETYREVLERATGKRSAAEMTEWERRQALDELTRLGAPRPKPAVPASLMSRPLRSGQAAKAIALWRALYNFGALRDGSEAALDRWVRSSNFRVSALRFADAPALNQVIEGLKAWLERAGGPAGPTDDDVTQLNAWRSGAGLAPVDAGAVAKFRLVEAQWRRLAEMGALHHGPQARLDTYLTKRGQVAAPQFLEPATADAIIEELGAWIRRMKKESTA